MEHTEMIFRELGILDIFKINDYLTGMFMFRYHRLKNLPECYKSFKTIIKNYLLQLNPLEYTRSRIY